MTHYSIRVTDRSRENFQKSVLDFFPKRYPFVKQEEVVSSSEIATYNIDNKYQGSKILVIGGGPTTNECSWDPSEYDFIFSCNHFFLHPRLKNSKVDLAFLCPEVKPNNDEFLSYFYSFGTVFCIENVDTPHEDILKYIELDKKRIGIVETRVKTKVGVTSHLMILATLFQPKQIDVVGMDGYPMGMKLGDDANHSFQIGKKLGGSRHYDGLYTDHYRNLWDYLLNDIGKNIIYRNLGYGHPYNVSSEFINVRIPD